MGELTDEEYEVLFGGDTPPAKQPSVVEYSSSSSSSEKAGSLVSWVVVGLVAVVVAAAVALVFLDGPEVVVVDYNGQVRSRFIDDVSTEHPGLPEGFLQLGDVQDIRPSGSTGVGEGPWTVRIPGDGPPDGSLPVVLHETPLGDWEALPAEYVDGVYVVVADSFSNYVPGAVSDAAGWLWDRTGDELVDAVSGRTDPPDPCLQTPAESPWATTSGPPSDGLFHICLEPAPFDRVNVRIRSNRGSAMWVVFPAGSVHELEVEGAPQWDILGPVLTSLSPQPGVDQVLLAPGRDMVMTFERPPTVSNNLEIFGYTDNKTRLFSGVSKNLGLSNAYLGTVWAAVGCLETGEDPTSPSIDLGDCLEVAAGLTESELLSAANTAVGNGRLAIEQGDWSAFARYAQTVDNNRATAATLQRVGRALGWGQLALDGFLSANDAALGYSDRAGLATVTLVAGGEPAQAAEPTPVQNERIVGLTFDPTCGEYLALVGEDRERVFRTVATEMGRQDLLGPFGNLNIAAACAQQDPNALLQGVINLSAE